MNIDPDVPQSVKAGLIKHLTEPFQTLAEAKSYWQENNIKLIIAEVSDGAALPFLQVSAISGNYH